MPYQRQDPLTLETFEIFLAPTILARGTAYFEKDAVTGLTGNNGIWSAVVTGSEKYQVEIKLSGGMIDACSCDCPHDADFCKHIVATLYAIKLSKPPVMQKSGPETLASGSSGRTLFANIVRKAINIASYGSGFIEYEDVRRFTSDIDRLLTQANTAYHNRQYAEVSDIAFAVIVELHKIVGYTEGKSAIGARIEKGFDLLVRLKAEDLPSDLRQRILEDAVKETKDPEYEGYGFDENWQKIIK
jgi:hypothetical protein